jgi:hypothetical protein
MVGRMTTVRRLALYKATRASKPMVARSSVAGWGTTSRKFGGLIPDEVIEFFQFI